MELRDYIGCFVIDGCESDEVDLRVILSTGGGVTTGSGSFPVPAALVGRLDEGPLTFRTYSGEEIILTVREVDPMSGEAFFLTGAALPIGLDAKETRQASSKGVA